MLLPTEAERYWLIQIESTIQKHADRWQDKSEAYWLARVMQEVGEFASALAGDHDDPAEWEAVQIISILTNWLKRRAKQSKRGRPAL